MAESASTIKRDIENGREPLNPDGMAAAAKAIAEARHRWGWVFGKRPPKVMAIDHLLAVASVRAFLAALAPAAGEGGGG